MCRERVLADQYLAEIDERYEAANDVSIDVDGIDLAQVISYREWVAQQLVHDELDDDPRAGAWLVKWLDNVTLMHLAESAGKHEFPLAIEKAACAAIEHRAGQAVHCEEHR